MGKNVAVGQEVLRFTYKVDASKIREMAQTLGYSDPIYFNSAAAQQKGYKDIIAPLTFGFAIKRWGSETDWPTTCRVFDIDPLMVLHGEQEFIYYGPISPGDEITVCEKVASIEEKAKMTVIVLECEFENQQGERVHVARQTLLERKKGDK